MAGEQASTKTCKGCGADKPAEKFRWIADAKRCPVSGGILAARCKPCEKITFAENAKKPRAKERRKIYKREQRASVAAKEGREFHPTGDAGNTFANRGLVARRRERESYLRACRAGWKSRPEWLKKAIAVQYYETIELPRSIIKSRKVYAANRERERLRVKKYKHANPHIAKRWGDTRWKRAAKQSDGTLTRDAIATLLKAKSCVYCATRINSDTATIDHLIPIALGGLHSATNAVACCRKCNSSKSARPFSEWVAMLDAAGSARALRLYLKRYGCDPEQATLLLTFGAV